jgi:hypothetical protein
MRWGEVPGDARNGDKGHTQDIPLRAIRGNQLGW